MGVRSGRPRRLGVNRRRRGGHGTAAWPWLDSAAGVGAAIAPAGCCGGRRAGGLRSLFPILRGWRQAAAIPLAPWPRRAPFQTALQQYRPLLRTLSDAVMPPCVTACAAAALRRGQPREPCQAGSADPVYPYMHPAASRPHGRVQVGKVLPLR